MARQLYVKFVESDVRALITLNEGPAPKTTAALWGALARPIQSPALRS